MKRRSKIALILLGLVIVALLALQTPLLATLRSKSWHLVIGSVGRVFKIGSLELDTSVQGQLQELQVENIRLRAHEKEYAQLKEQLGSPSFASLRAIPASVEARSVDTFHSQLILNKGSDNGVTLGAPVVVHGATLVGFIVELHEHSALLQLLVHPSTGLSAEVQQEQSPRGLLVGQKFTSLKLITIPRDATLEQGQPVVTVSHDREIGAEAGKSIISATGQNIPAGLLIGHLGAVFREENEAYQEAIVQLPYDLDQLRAVNILVLP